MIFKIQILTQEQTEQKHEFWENSPNRIAMNSAKWFIDKIDGSVDFFFIGERNDGLWIAFLNEDHLSAFVEEVNRYEQ